MNPDPLAIGKPMYKTALYSINELQMRLNELAADGWQLDKIVYHDEYDYLCIFIGWAVEELPEAK